MNRVSRQFAIDFTEEVKQLCKDFSDRQNRPYMGDVVSSLDALRDRTLESLAEAQAESGSVHTPTSSDEVATLRSALKEMIDRNHAVASLILDNDREGAVRWAKGLVLRTSSFVEVDGATDPLRRALQDAVTLLGKQKLEGFDKLTYDRVKEVLS